QLHLGQAVVVFPEGERTYDGQMHSLRPGIQLLIKRAQAPIIPIGIAGAFDALPRWRSAPTPAPLFWPACRARIAVSVGEPMEARRYAQMPREQSLRELFERIEAQWRRAERLRRRVPRELKLPPSGMGLEYCNGRTRSTPHPVQQRGSFTSREKQNSIVAPL